MLGPLTWLYRGFLEGMTADSHYLMASYLAQATVFLKPLAKEGKCLYDVHDAPMLKKIMLELAVVDESVIDSC